MFFMKDNELQEISVDRAFAYGYFIDEQISKDLTFIPEFSQYHKLGMRVANFEDSIRKFSSREYVDKITSAIGGLN